MTETSFPVTTFTGHDHTLPPLPRAAPVIEHHRHSLPAVDGLQEDDGQISCICGYFDDDGWTVQCDHCNRWQHQLCYYPDYEDRSLPEDLQHYCVDCHPRPYDHESARIRQQVKREDHASEVNGIKRQGPKNHKKKVKELGYTNGWPLDKSRHDRNSASPRDQPPPAKRPKTSHRPSESMSKGHSRKRNTSNVNHRRSLSRSPDTPNALYSEHFMQSYNNDNWDPIDVNLHNSIGVSNALSEWLNASDESFREMHNHEKTEVLNRWDGLLEHIPGKAEIEIRVGRDDRVGDIDGTIPMWKWVTVQDSVASGAYIGELKGHVGFKEEYIHDPSNRWPMLRHPEPFVFFHPQLPIYIDARGEGTELRYVRRSCQPNARLQILVTDSTAYRYCFMATQQIDPGMEVSVAWDTRDGVPELQRKLQSGLMEGDMDHICAWVSKALANCGPCACHLTGDECMMARLDRRGHPPKFDDDSHAVKAPKMKRKKLANHISPLNTHINSRSGSEARRGDLDDEPSDTRSPSGSTGRDSASRDQTPNTNGGLSAIPELSERERKKLAKEEEMFKKQEEEQTGKSGKKKRNSGGSNLNTPNATTSRQLGFNTSSKYASAGTSRQTGLPSAKPGKRHKSGTAPTTPAAKGMKRPKPDYVDSEVQCDLEKEEVALRIPPSLPRKPFLSITQRLLQRCAMNNVRRKGPEAVAEAQKLLDGGEKMDVDRSANDSSTSKPEPPANMSPPDSPEPASMPMQRATNDTDTNMADATAIEQADTLVQVDSNVHHVYEENPSPTTSSDPSQPQIVEPAPPWPSQAAHSANESIAPFNHHPNKPLDMHLQMPPPPANPFAPPAPALLSGNPNSVSGLATVSSPMGLPGGGSIFSPAVNAAVTPSPAKKKMSLSDYTKRNKAKDKDVESKGDRESSPASVASGPVVPPLQASSSELLKGGENSSAVEDDVKMEDAGEVTTAI